MKGGQMRRLRTCSVVLGVLLAILVPASPASAERVLLNNTNLPSPVSVGTTGSSTLTIANTSTGSDAATTWDAVGVSFVPSCGELTAGLEACSRPEPGVFSLGATATGRTGTACAGASYPVGSPDANGVVSLTMSAPIHLGAAGSATASCTIDFTFTVLKQPAVDADPSTAGVQTWTLGLLVVNSGLNFGASATRRLVTIEGGSGTTATTTTTVGTGTGTGTAAAQLGTATPGQTIGLNGSGFPAGATVTLTLSTGSVVLATVTADAAGAFSARVTIPAATPQGASTIVASGGGVSRAFTITIAGTTPLARTGAAATQQATTAAALVAAGLLLVFAGRRRRRGQLRRPS